MLARPIASTPVVQDFALSPPGSKGDIELDLAGGKLGDDLDIPMGKEGRSALQEAAHQNKRLIGNLHEKVEKM